MTEIPYQTIFTWIVKYGLTIFTFSARNLFATSLFCYQHFPNASKIVALVLVLYIFYKFSRAIFFWWLNTIISTIKTFVLIGTVVFGCALYFRGWDSVVYSDIPLLRSLVWNNIHRLSYLFNGKLKPENLKKSIIDGDFSSYFNYYEENIANKDFSYDDVLNLVNKGKDTLENLEVDWKKAGQNVLDMFKS